MNLFKKIFFCIQIINLKLWKILIRVKRFIVRCCKNLVPIILLIPIILLYAFFISKYENISLIQAIYEIKSTIFTTIVVSSFLNIVNSERERKAKLSEQYWAYYDLNTLFEESIKKLTCFPKCESIFFSDKTIKQYIDKLEDYHIDKEEFIKLKEDIKTISHRITVKQESYIKHMQDESVAKIYFLDIEEEFENILNLNKNDNEKIIESIKNIVTYMFWAIEEIRKIWREDEKIDKKICTLMYEINPNIIEEDYYLKRRYDYEEV